MSCAELTWLLILRGFVGAFLSCALLFLRALVCALLSARFCLARFCYGAAPSFGLYFDHITCIFEKKNDSCYAKKRILWNCIKIVDSWDFALYPNRVVQGSDGPAGRVGSRFCRILADRIGSALFCSSSPEPFCGSISNEGRRALQILYTTILLLFRICLVFYWLFLGTWIDMNFRILHSDWLISYDI